MQIVQKKDQLSTYWIVDLFSHLAIFVYLEPPGPPQPPEEELPVDMLTLVKVTESPFVKELKSLP